MCYECYLIVPAMSEVAGQCRIYTKDFDVLPKNPLKDYRSNPDAWKEVGLMNSKGELVCLSAPLGVRYMLENNQPLMASQWFVSEVSDV